MTGPFRTRRRVEFGDTDMAGIAHFANFFRYMEVAETDFWHAVGLSVSWLDGEGGRYGLPRVSVACDYLKPAHFEDILDIDVRVERVGTKSLTLTFEFSRTGEPIARGRITSVFCRHTHDGRIDTLALPEEIRSKLS